MNYSYGTNADQYINKEGLEYLISQLDLKYSGDSGTVDLTNYYDKAEIDNLLANIDTGGGSTGNDGVGIQSVELVNYELIVTLTDATVINLGNVRGEKGLQGIQGLDGAKGTDGINGTDGADGKGITSVVKTNTVDLVDTYTITYSDMTTSNFTVTNGADGSGGSSGGSSTDTYSTDETVVGTWLDGKTIYRKCFTFGALGVEEYTFNHNIANISTIVDYRQKITFANGNTLCGGAYIASYRQATFSKNDLSVVKCSPTQVIISIGGNVMNCDIIVYMDYTKTV